MSDTLVRLEHFIAQWRTPLESGAEVFFKARAHQGVAAGAPTQIANSFVSECGFATIGHHWEMLDPTARAEEPRSAIGAFEDALSRDLAMRTDWLGTECAARCGAQFVDAFEPTWATIVTNHIARDGGQSEGWNPISTSALEWAFVGFDRDAIALLLLTGED